MENKNSELIETIWKDDKLGRINEARHLNRFLENKFQAEESRPFVMNIDSGWGHGKTFFITHFAEQLRQSGHPVVIFDAWKNDFSNEALLSFISCVCLSLKAELVSEETALAQVEKLKELAKSFVKPALPILLAALVKQLTGVSADRFLNQDETEGKVRNVDELTDLSAKLTNLATSKALEVYDEKKNATESFTATIASLVKIVAESQDKYLPIYIFVDELDRCRPLFSIELLESIKHLFSTSGVYFIVSTDTEQLCHSIKAVYGSGFDARRYLKRFFDTEYQLDTPHIDEFSFYLFSTVSLPDEKIFIPESLKQQSKFKLHLLFGHICYFFKLGARDIQQIFEIVKVSVYISEKPVHFIYLMLLACMYHKYPKQKNLVLNARYSDIQKFRDFINNGIIDKSLIEPVTHYLYIDDSISNRPKSLSLLTLFQTYLSCVNIEFDKTNQMSNIENDIVEQLIQDNKSDDLNVRATKDLTLEKYIDLVLRAGKFHSL